MPGIIRILTIIISVLPVFFSAAEAQTKELALEGPSAVVKEGYFTLYLTGTSREQNFQKLEIEQSTDQGFTQVQGRFPFLGSFKQISLSGFNNGDYWFRARGEHSNGEVFTTAPVAVTVNHYPLWQALTLFSIGAVMFLIVAGYILLAARRSGSHHG